jgi:osmotically-inducible protein OsmY
MKNTLLITTLTAGLVLASGCGRSTRTDTAATDTTTYPATTTTPTTTAPMSSTSTEIDQAASRTSGAIADAGRSSADATREAALNTGDAMRRTGDAMSAKMREWRLSAQDLEADLRADREIVRTKSSVGAPTGNVDKSALKANVETQVKGQAMGINDLDVEIDNETEVVLTGEAQSAQQVSQAMGAALSTNGVTKVTSKIKLKQ